MNNTNLTVSVVVPVYEEAGNIRPLADEVFDALAGRMHYELIFVDDGSSDGTVDDIHRAMARDPAVRICEHTANKGQSAALRTGVTAARANIIAVLDGDGQNDPADIPSLLAELKSGPTVKMVIGRRIKRKDRWVRRVSSRVANGVRSRLLKDGILDTGCGIKVFYRDDFLGLPAFDHMHRFLPALFQRNGGKVSAVPVNHRERWNGTSKYGIRNRLWVGITDILGVIWLQKRRI